MTMAADTIPEDLVGTWDFDPNHSTLGAVARYAMLTNVRGHFGSFSGTITVGETLAECHVEVEIDAASIDTGNGQRDGHLRSGDFLDVEHHPTITFSSTRVESRDERRYTVAGDLTMRGVTREVELDTRFEGIGPDPWGNTRAGIAATTSINRKDWGVSWNTVIEAGGVLVGDTLAIELNVSAIKRTEDGRTGG
jgi:polyisoprenoid-binding protein YceI